MRTQGQAATIPGIQRSAEPFDAERCECSVAESQSEVRENRPIQRDTYLTEENAFISLFSTVMGRDSSVSIATRYGLDGTGI